MEKIGYIEIKFCEMDGTIHHQDKIVLHREELRSTSELDHIERYSGNMNIGLSNLMIEDQVIEGIVIKATANTVDMGKVRQLSAEEL